MDPVVEKTMFRLYHTIFYMNLDKVRHNFCIKNDPFIKDPSFAKSFEKKLNSKMSDWEEEENKYFENPEKYMENIEKQLDLEREIRNKNQITMQLKCFRSEAGVKRNYEERNQRGFHLSYPPKAPKRKHVQPGH